MNLQSILFCLNSRISIRVFRLMLLFTLPMAVFGQQNVNYISHRTTAFIDGQTTERWISHPVYRDLTVEPFTGEGFPGGLGVRIVLGDGHTGVWVERVRQVGTNWAVEQGWLLSNGDFHPDQDLTRTVSVNEVAETELGEFYRWVEGTFYSWEWHSVSDIQQVGLNQISSRYNLAHPGWRQTFEVQHQLYPFANYDISHDIVTVYLVYEAVGAEPDLVRLQSGTYRIEGLIWDDYNLNGLPDPEERGWGGIALRLIDSSGQEVGFTRSGFDGSYGFDIDEAGTYRVEMNQPLDTRTAKSVSSSAGSAFLPLRIHNNPGLTELWDVRVSTAELEVGPNSLVVTANGGLTHLPRVVFHPSVVRVAPSPGETEEFLVMLEINRVWDMVSLFFDFLPGSGDLKYWDDFQMLPGVVFGTSIFSLKSVISVRVQGNQNREEAESLFIAFSTINNPEIASTSSGMLLVVEAVDPPPPEILPIITELYVGRVGADDGSPAVVFRQASGYQFGTYIAQADAAFFSELEPSAGNGFRMDTPIGSAGGILRPEYIEGFFSEAGIPFRLKRSSAFGPFANSAGLYYQSNLGGADWQIYAVVTPDGTLLFYSEFEGEGAGGSFSLGSSGRFNVPLAGGGSVRGNVTRTPPYEIIAVYEESGFTADIRLTRISALNPNPSGPLSFLLAGADITEDWIHSPTFGSFRVPYPDDQWLQHQDWGSMWLTPEGQNAFWFRPEGTDAWLWSTEALYPILYSPSQDSWLHYVESSNGNWAYNYQTGHWQKLK